ncbi:hypothetical protein, partial [Heyndrickxia coagulans]|uniref:hypothetical protein n=1 Tax=Heyndrickxia coagulans TaxID=1398 RepID=UPI00214D3FD5
MEYHQVFLLYFVYHYNNKSMEEHLSHFKLVLGVLRQHQFFVNKDKCCFAQQSLNYLEHVVLTEGVAAHQSKIEAMVQWP